MGAAPRTWLESATTVGFSEPCPCCGNRKRRCLHPPFLLRSPPPPAAFAHALVAPTVPFPPLPPFPLRAVRCLHPPARSRKKLLLFEAASALSPSSSPTRPVLLRPESSPLPSSSRSASLSLTPSWPLQSPFLLSYPFPSRPFGRTIDPAFPAFPRNLESVAEAFRFPPLTVAPPVSHPSPDQVNLFAILGDPSWCMVYLLWRLFYECNSKFCLFHQRLSMQVCWISRCNGIMGR